MGSTSLNTEAPPGWQRLVGTRRNEQLNFTEFNHRKAQYHSKSPYEAPPNSYFSLRCVTSQAWLISINVTFGMSRILSSIYSRLLAWTKFLSTACCQHEISDLCYLWSKIQASTKPHRTMQHTWLNVQLYLDTVTSYYLSSSWQYEQDMCFRRHILSLSIIDTCCHYWMVNELHNIVCSRQSKRSHWWNVFFSRCL